jgi:hypothetical protein
VPLPAMVRLAGQSSSMVPTHIRRGRHILFRLVTMGVRP